MGANIHNHRFLCQRYTAGLRGIEWNLTFQEWWDWWQATGHYNERGCKKGMYVMSRPGDKGPYALNNIVCKTHVDNTLECLLGKKKGPSPLRGRKTGPNQYKGKTYKKKGTL
jgi:hypothetical protein